VCTFEPLVKIRYESHQSLLVHVPLKASVEMRTEFLSHMILVEAPTLVERS
jgi:hypothetical protein